MVDIIGIFGQLADFFGGFKDIFGGLETVGKIIKGWISGGSAE